MVWVIPFCPPVAELNQWLGTQKLSGVDRSAQTRQVHIKSPGTHMMHTPPNSTCSRWYDHEWLKADYKPDSPPPPPTSVVRVATLSLYPMCGSLSNFSCFLPWTIGSDLFLSFFFKHIFFFFATFVLFSLTWNPMGAKNCNTETPSKYSSRKFWDLWIFFSMVLTELCWDFWNFETWNVNYFCILH